MFQTKSFLSILASMINRARATTNKTNDFTVGSIQRTLLEAPAQEMDEVYQQMAAALTDAIPVAVYNSFNFQALPAVSATGSIRVTFTSSTTVGDIPPNTVFTAATGSTITYSSIVDTPIPAGNTYADVPVVASAPGAAGNILAGTAFTLAPSPSGFISATNLAAFANGLDAETPAQRQARFNTFILGLSRATNSGFYAGITGTYLTDSAGNVIERVATTAIVEPYTIDPVNNPPGLVDVYVYNGTGGTSAALVGQVLQTLTGSYNAAGVPIDGYAAAGVQVFVSAATETPQAFAGAITLASGADGPTVTAAATLAISTYIAGLAIGTPTSTASTFVLAEARALVMQVPGVFDLVTSAPTANVTAGIGVKLTVGAITLTAA